MELPYSGAGIAVTAPLERNSLGGTNSHDPEVGSGERSNADLGVDVEDGRGGAAERERLDADASKHVVVVVVRSNQVLLEDDLLAVVTGEGVAGTDGTGLALGEGGVAGEAGLDDGESMRVSKCKPALPSLLRQRSTFRVKL